MLVRLYSVLNGTKTKYSSTLAKTGLFQNQMDAASDSASPAVVSTKIGQSRFTRILRSDDLKEQDKPPVVIAPMVAQSELAFRMQCRRRSGARVCFTPMINARQFIESSKYRQEVFSTCDEDRPLITQLAGNDPQMLLRAAKVVEHQCDGIDINLGCPQHIARRGKYGSFLLEHTELLEQIVSTLSQNLTIPVSCKIRLVPGAIENTIALCTRLEKAGCEMVTVHGRYREQNKHLIGECNWDAIRQVKLALSIPVMANGGIGNPDDVKRCYETTGVDGVMTCEAVLENPALFGPDDATRYPDPFEITYEYLDLAEKYPAGQPKPARGHLFKFLATALARHPEFYIRLGKARTLQNMREHVQELQALHTSGQCTIDNCATLLNGPWYARHRGVHSFVIRSGGGEDDCDAAPSGKQKQQQNMQKPVGESDSSDDRPEKMAKVCGDSEQVEGGKCCS